MFLRIFRYLTKGQRQMCVAIFFLVAAQVWLELKVPDYMAEITTLVETPGSTLQAIFASGGMMLLCAFASMVVNVMTSYFCARVAAGFAMVLRDRVFTRAQSFSFEELGRFSVASLITRSTNDITQIQSVLAMGLQAVIKSPMMAIWACFKISSKQWQWTATAAVAVALLLIMNIVIFIFAEPRFRIMQALTDQVNLVTREHLTGLRVVRAYNAEAYQEAKFEKANEDLTRTSLFTSRLMAVFNPGMMLIMNGLNLAIYWLGAYLVQKAGMELRVSLFADMVVFSSYAMQIIFSFDMLVMIFIMAPRSIVSAKRVLEILETEPTILDGPGIVTRPEDAGTVSFEHVSFRYPGTVENVLTDISFSVKKGQTLAIIGSTGAGKSTLVNLILRFYDPSSGTVRVDGADLKDFCQKDLRSRIGFIPQKNVLFSGTVFSNVTTNAEETAENAAKLRRAIEIAQGAEFVDSLEDGTAAAVSQGGSNFSGGQKQRLAIARAVYREPEILIFDDSFSALDYKTDHNLRTALRTATAGTTCIIVAQRIGTILEADQIIVLDRGRIDGIGTHHELLKTSPVYQQIARSQLSEEELRNV